VTQCVFIGEKYHNDCILWFSCGLVRGISLFGSLDSFSHGWPALCYGLRSKQEGYVTADAKGNDNDLMPTIQTYRYTSLTTLGNVPTMQRFASLLS
jgi:hypothetical protein